MAQRKIKLTRNGDVYLPEKTVKRLIDSRSGEAALVYLYLAAHDGMLDDRAAMNTLGMSDETLARALGVLARLGLTEAPEQMLDRPDTLPEYTGDDVSLALSSDGTFAGLLKFTETRLGRRLSTVDTQTLLGIYSWMGLPADVICLLVTSCIEEHKKKFGEGRRPTMRAIEKRAKLWCELGLFTAESAGVYLKQQEERGSRIATVARLLQIGGRALSQTEQKYLELWSGFTDELILKAYDITVVKTGRLTWKFMDTILQSWAAKGFCTVADVETGETRTAKTETASVSHLREMNRTWEEEE